MAEDFPAADETETAHAQEEAELERHISLNEHRIRAVIAALHQSGARRVLDLGCGEWQLVRALLKEKAFDEIVGIDVSHRALEMASERLRLDEMPEKQRERLKLAQGSLMYRDSRISGYDDAAVVDIAGKRLSAGKLTVVDATNVQPEARKPLVALAAEKFSAGHQTSSPRVHRGRSSPFVSASAVFSTRSRSAVGRERRLPPLP